MIRKNIPVWSSNRVGPADSGANLEKQGKNDIPRISLSQVLDYIPYSVLEQAKASKIRDKRPCIEVRAAGVWVGRSETKRIIVEALE